MLVGTGVACAHKNYGTGADCSLGAVEIDPLGRIVIRIDDTEMGNGLGTAAANRVAVYLGGIAAEVALAQIDALVQAQPNNPYFLELKGQALMENGRAADAVAPFPEAGTTPAAASRSASDEPGTGRSTIGTCRSTSPASNAASSSWRCRNTRPAPLPSSTRSVR